MLYRLDQHLLNFVSSLLLFACMSTKIQSKYNKPLANLKPTEAHQRGCSIALNATTLSVDLVVFLRTQDYNTCSYIYIYNAGDVQVVLMTNPLIPKSLWNDLPHMLLHQRKLIANANRTSQAKLIWGEKHHAKAYFIYSHRLNLSMVVWYRHHEDEHHKLFSVCHSPN